MLTQKKILLGICGGIAAYKCAELVRELRRAGAEVRVMMTQTAQNFITTTTLQTLCGHPVYTNEWLNGPNAAMDHIELARWADLVLIAPATADSIARLAFGHANDLLTTTCLATTAPIFLAPAMNTRMWENSLVKANIERLQQHHIQIIPPADGEQACGDIGPGRLPEPTQLIHALTMTTLRKPIFLGQTILITAGPTYEPLDPVRYLGNYSSGKMGYALAQAAAEQGAAVILISGPTTLTPPPKVKCIPITTAEEMLAAVMQHIAPCNIFIAAAAVADYRPKKIAAQKIKKQSSSLTLELIKNPDILTTVAQLSPRPFTVGFAAETENLAVHAKLKLAEKQLDLIIANQVGARQGFNVDHNAALVIDKFGQITDLPLTTKSELAQKIMLIIQQQIYHREFERS